MVIRHRPPGIDFHGPESRVQAVRMAPLSSSGENKKIHIKSEEIFAMEPINLSSESENVSHETNVVPVVPSISTGLKLEPKYKFGGRPKGIKDSHPRQAPYFKISHWFKKLNQEWPKLYPSQRADLCFSMIKLISGKLPALPKTQRESIKTAHEVYDSLLELERSSAQPTSDSVKKSYLIQTINKQV